MTDQFPPNNFIAQKDTSRNCSLQSRKYVILINDSLQRKKKGGEEEKKHAESLKLLSTHKEDSTSSERKKPPDCFVFLGSEIFQIRKESVNRLERDDWTVVSTRRKMLLPRLV